MSARRRVRPDGRAGFTLLEALVAMALTALIVSALAALTAQWLRSWDRGLVRIEQDEQLALRLERLVEDLAAAEFIPIDRQALESFFEGDAHQVTFVRTALSPNGGPGLDIVHLGEVAGPVGPTLVRSRARFTPLPAGPKNRDLPKFVDPVVLASPPYRVAFSYAGADRVWRDVWRHEMLLPKAIRLTLRQTGASPVRGVTTAVPLHVDVPAECIAAKSLAECIARGSKATSSDTSSPAHRVGG